MAEAALVFLDAHMTAPGIDILLVEDDPDTRANLCDILELDGYTVGVAGSAQEARDLNDWDQIRVIILDRRLPDATAEELLPEIRARAPRTDVIVVTGYGDMESTVVALQHGAADYIIKPVNPDMLRKSVERILERRRMECALQQEHELSDRMLNTVDAAVVLLDLNGKVLRINRFLSELSGWTSDEVVGVDWFDTFLPERDREAIRDVFRRTAAGIETSGTLNPIVTREGKERRLRWSNTTLRDEAGETTAVLSAGVDVTELLEAQEAKVQSARLAAIGQTMTAMAHESRNALQRIQAALDMLKLEMDQNPEAMGDIGRIGRAATELHGLHEQVRNYAAPINLEKVAVQVPDVWHRAWNDLAQVREGRDATLKQETGGIPLRMELDTMRFGQVFRNLFQNSLTASEDPVVITVTCRETQLDDRPAVQFSIRDNGPGLNAEQKQKIFVAFFTTKQTGTGLGMAIVERIVEAHGGTISVGRASDGADFLITLPRTGAA